MSAGAGAANHNGIEVGQDVFLILESGLLVSGSVDSIDGPALELSISCDEGRPELTAGAVTLQFISRRGVCQLEGEIPDVDSGRETLRFRPTSEVVLVQRREYVRVDAVIPVVCVRAQQASRSRASTKTANLSGGGFLLVEGCGLHLDHVAHFILELGDGGEPVAVTGRVVRQTDTGELGVQIEQISRRDRERIVHWVFDRERVDRRAAARRADFKLIRRAE
jgi:PilZ domain-containing protein